MLDGSRPDGAAPPEDAQNPSVCFGKVPTYGDFVRYNAGGGTVRALEKWFQEGLHNLNARMRSHSLNGAYQHAPTTRFVFCPTASSTLLVGVLRMSHDEAGRRYPFAVAASVDKKRMQPRRTSLLPFCDASFLDDAARLVEEATSGTIGRDALPERLDALVSTGTCVPEVASENVSAAEVGLEEYFKETTFRTFAEHIWGDFDDSRKYLVLRNLLDSLRPVSRSVPARFSLGLRFPLSGEKDTAVREVGFWVKLSLRVLDANNVTPSFFWNAVPGEEEDTAALLLFFRPPPPRAFPHLLPIPLKSDNICELERSGREDAVRVVLELPDRHGRLLESDSVTLWEFLNHF